MAGMDKVCIKCGGTEWSKDGRRCAQCNRAKVRAWYADNPEKARAYLLANREKLNARGRAWAAANREKLRAKARAHSAANREKMAAKTREWAYANPEKVKAMRKTYYAANKEKLLAKSLERDRADPIRARAKKYKWAADNPGKVQEAEIAYYNRRKNAIAQHDAGVALTTLLERKDKPLTLHDMTDGQVLHGLKTSLTMTAEGYRRAAPFYVELVERGYGADISTAILSYLPDVAAGRLDPELLARFGGAPGLLEAVSTLLPEDQAKLLANDCKVDVLDAPGKAPRSARLDGLTATKLRQVIADRRILPPSEQVHHLSNNPPPDPVLPVHRSESDYDLRHFLNQRQLDELVRVAERVKTTPGKLIIRWAVSRGHLPDAPAKDIAA